MDIRERVGWTMKAKNKYDRQRDEPSGNERCGPAEPAPERSVPLAVLPCRGLGEASTPGWACDSLTGVFLTNYPCHCVKWWKAGGAGRRVQMEEMLLLLFLINNVAIIPYKQPGFFSFFSKRPWHSPSRGSDGTAWGSGKGLHDTAD